MLTNVGLDFKQKYQNYVNCVNQELEKIIFSDDCPQKSLYDAMSYSLMGDGKRVRPIFALSVCEMLGGNLEDVLPFACAIEMIHTASLIHDDLPAMDNDLFRRGKPTNHKVFGEAVAILAGDSLLNGAYEIISKVGNEKNNNCHNILKAINILAVSTGASGIMGGQAIDIQSDNKSIDIDLLNKMHKMKTGALIEASILIAAVLSNATEDKIDSLRSFAQSIGLAFQIKDDILDVIGSSNLMGKATGRDETNKKTTYVSVYGVKKSNKILKLLINQSIEILDNFEENSDFLKNLILFLSKRDR